MGEMYPAPLCRDYTAAVVGGAGEEPTARGFGGFAGPVRSRPERRVKGCAGMCRDVDFHC